MAREFYVLSSYGFLSTVGCGGGGGGGDGLLEKGWLDASAVLTT